MNGSKIFLISFVEINRFWKRFTVENSATSVLCNTTVLCYRRNLYATECTVDIWQGFVLRLQSRAKRSKVFVAVSLKSITISRSVQFSVLILEVANIHLQFVFSHKQVYLFSYRPCRSLLQNHFLFICILNETATWFQKSNIQSDYNNTHHQKNVSSASRLFSSATCPNAKVPSPRPISEQTFSIIFLQF